MASIDLYTFKIIDDVERILAGRAGKANRPGVEVRLLCEQLRIYGLASWAGVGVENHQNNSITAVYKFSMNLFVQKMFYMRTYSHTLPNISTTLLHF